ncbi:MAG: FdhF/YdeP family oxidoreductase [Ilumatobacteraceae bacterium]
MALPRSWVSLSPNGLGHQKPNHFGDMAKVALKVRGRARDALKILREGVCDGCALGVAGFHDWTLDGVHLCTTRLNLLPMNLAEPFDHDVLSDVTWLQNLPSDDLREMGRLVHPMRRRRGERGFTRITWDDALAAIADGIRSTDPDRTAFYLTSRGITNETYYVAGKAARAMGVANIDSAARTCHAPSTVGLKQTIGVAASTNSMQDVLETDVVVLWGTNVANNQPVFTKYLYLAKKRGTKVVVVNPYLEPGLERYWVPSNVESALFGTRLCDLHVPVRPGGDVALANAVLKRLIALDAVDLDFVRDHTEHWEDLVEHLDALELDDLLDAAGVDRPTLDAFVDTYAHARSAILVWSMGITQHRHGVDGVRSIVNVGLARGNVGRDGAGMMPIRGHSGVQGGAEMGAYATALPGGDPIDPEHAATWSQRWGFQVPAAPGLTATEMVEAAERGELDVMFLDGSNLLEILPQPDRVAEALGRIGLRVHQDIVLTSQMFVEGDDVILLPAATRYEQEGGGTSTTTERRIAFSPQVLNPPGEARSEWRVFADLATRVRPEVAEHFDWADNLALRTEIGTNVAMYAGIETLRTTGDQVQYGGRHLCAGGEFPTPSGRAVFSLVDVRPPALAPGQFSCSTRRGKQFNSMVYAEVDPLTGAGRDAVYLDEHDASRAGIADGDPIRLRSEHGTFDGHARLVRLPHRSLQVHWPEGNALLGSGPDAREPQSRIPDYNTVVTLEPIGRTARTAR